MKLIHSIGDVIRAKYYITKIIGKGGVGITYGAEIIGGIQKVAIKVISLQYVDNFKILELFEREAKTLSQIDHPNIPKYIDYFQIDRPTHRLFYIVQQLAEGENFDDLIKEGWNPNENEVQQIAERLLETLSYLQQLVPPVIHRDIKPQNIIYNLALNFQDKGNLFLVDFGAVQDTYHDSLTGGSTIVGTYGYMAPEQFRGQSNLSTDLYGLGVTLIFLLTHQHPAELPQKKLKIDWRSQVKQGKLDKHFATWLDSMIEPVIEERFRSAEEALAILRGEKVYTTYNSQRKSRPEISKIVIKEIGNKLNIYIPQVLLRSSHSRFFLSAIIIWNIFLLFYLWIFSKTINFTYITHIVNSIPLSTFNFLAFLVLIDIWIILLFLLTLAIKNKKVMSICPALLSRNYSDFLLFILVSWNIFLLLIIFQAIDVTNIINIVISTSGFNFIVFFVFIDVWIIILFLISCLSKIYIGINTNSIAFRREIFACGIQSIRVKGNIGEILQVSLKKMLLSIKRGYPITVCNLTIKCRNIRFASFLSEEEKQWLVEEIQDFVERQKLKLEEE